MFKNRTCLSTQMIALMFCIIFLLNLNFTLLRSLRTTLAIADLGGRASSIPYFELCGVLPAACLMTWMLSYLLRFFSMPTVFLITLALFLIFYVTFAFFYPVLSRWHEEAKSSSNDPPSLIINACVMTFYIIGELWKPALIQVLFWGFINLSVPLTLAKRIYPALMFGASLGSIVAGPTILGCTSLKIWNWIPLSANQWSHSFILMIFFVCATSTVTAWLYLRLSSLLVTMENRRDVPRENALSLKTSIRTCWHSSFLKWISWIVLADYVVYSLGEVIFLEVLKQKFPDPSEYCRYMGYLAFWSSSLTVISATLFTPLCVKKCRWVTVALMLPIALFLIEGTFFLFLRVESISRFFFGWNHREWIACIVWLGSFQYCGCRAMKYTFFDTAKELAFVALPKIEQMQGKLVVDGICSRLGRGGASALSLVFISCAGGILASSLIAGITACGLSLSWALATIKLGKQIDTREVLSA